MTDGVPFKIGASVFGGEGVDDVRAVVVHAAAAVSFCKLSCRKNTERFSHTRFKRVICS